MPGDLSIVGYDDSGSVSTSRPYVWGATAAEVAAGYRCDELLPAAPGRLLRAVDSAGGRAATFRWLCQLRAAPYSYDWIDNRGRPSPRRLLDWCADLDPGQRFMTIFTLESFRADRELTLLMRPGVATAVFGELAVTYRVNPRRDGSRLVVAIRVSDPAGPLGVQRRWLLAWGDLVVMRKQLLTLADLAGTVPEPPGV